MNDPQKIYLHSNTLLYYNVNIMKMYNERAIKSSEIIQLIILHSLYSLIESKNIYFQGGTAIRWCYSGNRFSEDLYFVTHLRGQDINTLILKMSENIRRNIIAHLGPGEFEVRSRKISRISSYSSFIQFRPIKERKKISVKLEFEQLKEGYVPETEKVILSQLPFVRHFITIGEFRIPNPNSVIIVETKEEILSDKIRALFEREYLKGRDFYDLWFLNSLKVKCKSVLVERKLHMYEASFINKRNLEYFINPSGENKKEIIEAIQQDLSRFLSPQEMSLFESSKFKEIFDALKHIFSPLRESELPLF